MNRITTYLATGAIIGGVIGAVYGFCDGLQQTHNELFEAIHNMTSGNPNPFTIEYLTMARDMIIGATGGAVLGGLAGLVNNPDLKAKNVLSTNRLKKNYDIKLDPISKEEDK